MLILSRNPGDEIDIGPGKKIKIKILKVGKGKVTIGIEADKEQFQIVRSELLDSPKAEPAFA